MSRIMKEAGSLKLTYKQRIFLWFVVMFAAFTTGIVIFEQSRERQDKTEALTSRLDVYADMVDAALRQHSGDRSTLDSLETLFPAGIRLTLIDRQGAVLYDNATPTIENHAARPEIVRALEQGTGTNIRTSASNSVEYLYYAKRFDDYFVRVSLPYDIRVRHLLKPGGLFLWYVMALFAVVLLLINYVAGRFGKSIGQLKDFTLAAQRDGADLPPFDFPDDELGEIGAKISESYSQLKGSRKKIALEREKLLQHVHSSEEGICFFSADRSVEFHNGLFMQYLNMLSDRAEGDPGALFSDPVFGKAVSFLDDVQRSDSYFETQAAGHGRCFALRVNVFEDGSFEVVVNDVTAQEKTRRLKQEMTGNIAHELRTPVTSIRGYLETVLEQEMARDRERLFLQKAYDQTLTLSELIRDMGLITKIEEAPHSFSLEAVPIRPLVESLVGEFEPQLRERGIVVENNVPDDVVVNGNRNLLCSVFRNLTDNVVRYAGENVTIRIGQYNEDGGFHYFSFSDNGIGIPDQHHLTRLFERFYRVNQGRTRDSGGSGLGLSIVRNAVAFHRGTIAAKNAAGGGLEFLFKLPKWQESQAVEGE